MQESIMKLQIKLSVLLLLVNSSGSLWASGNCSCGQFFCNDPLECITREYSPEAIIQKDYEDSVLKNKPIIIPIGDNCTAASVLGFVNLRYLSCPFDWYQSTFEQIYRLLENDFADFFNTCYLARVKDLITSVKYGIKFHHDFSTDPKTTGFFDWQKEIPSVQDKYKRRIDRFYKICHMGRPIYFLRCRAMEEIRLSPVETASWLERLVSLIRVKFPQLQFTILYGDFDPAVEKIRRISQVKTFRYTVQWNHPPPIEKMKNEWTMIFKKLGIL
jgi:hypothetical protein